MGLPCRESPVLLKELLTPSCKLLFASLNDSSNEDPPPGLGPGCIWSVTDFVESSKTLDPAVEPEGPGVDVGKALESLPAVFPAEPCAA